ncbi:beta-1,3-galactosyl-O-glycosyl-glycoprotein beta-1,6-N-acetylglucosaminyltransferase 4-like isoform X2 [Oncorhynchus mykiss]|nr:beta-1,3-galactosyl-O-glycosyl-glycoprotein beta-1,6-N-acetylglucosaminyltransferase 4 isoform X2 [Oncorhynchus mykiss]XP_021458653.1 beta-1,3-galactosyl-O-glycosyl-glycoprotein beta-1,6-N-acetylglucosaminyltransferase 4 isoform X2 [Oncorhynchus mykiss]XP_021458654.1 beta-1,3-galactosyl-O-glycosyl-glycoprotein beta-1,6-N-acetylglucosaminyltransferase 4 isoform X2 [Oncorhynchus mykiss]XP_036833482.1 beta-1,3-galactosyl-O-glycosyl-glycoprotein beta-1,6-N-acetylglucosaminyltransferase 4-like iso
MKIRFAFPSRLRKKNFISSLSLLLVICAFLLLFLKFTVKYSITIETYGSTAGYNDIELLHRYNIDCNAIYEMEPAELGKSLVIRKQVVVEEQDKSLVNLISNCPRYLRSRGYGDVQVSEEEQAFPLAYSLVVHKSASMVEKILRAVYTPNNIYCIHYDLKSSELFRESMEGLARCLPNVFIASKLEAVTYASISRLNADLNCLSDLIGSKVKWRYVINLCGQDFPLRSNIELVADLKKLRGGNMMETSRPSEYKKQRFSFHHELQNASFEYHRLPVKTNKAKGPPPHGIQMFIGSAYFVLSLEFVTYMNKSALARDFLMWSNDTYSPDEHFWATLTRVPGVPGEVPRAQADITDLMSKTRLVKWNYLEGPLYPSCTGKHVRSVCIYGAGELRWLLNYGSWFANKVDAKVDPVLIQCLEDTLQEKQRLLVKAMKSQQKIPSSVLAVDVILQ